MKKQDPQQPKNEQTLQFGTQQGAVTTNQSGAVRVTGAKATVALNTTDHLFINPVSNITFTNEFIDANVITGANDISTLHLHDKWGGVNTIFDYSQLKIANIPYKIYLKDNSTLALQYITQEENPSLLPIDIHMGNNATLIFDYQKPLTTENMLAMLAQKAHCAPIKIFMQSNAKILVSDMSRFIVPFIEITNADTGQTKHLDVENQRIKLKLEICVIEQLESLQELLFGNKLFKNHFSKEIIEQFNDEVALVADIMVNQWANDAIDQ